MRDFWASPLKALVAESFLFQVHSSAAVNSVHNKKSAMVQEQTLPCGMVCFTTFNVAKFSTAWGAELGPSATK